MANATKTDKASFGVMGLGVMGSSLAQNIEDHDFSVAVWNLEPEWTDRFMEETAGHQFVATKEIKEFVEALERPRRILIMIKAGDPVDQTLEKLVPLLDQGDIVIDGGNSWFQNTRRREAMMSKHGFHFVGMGVSGGEEGARFGPSLMPGGSTFAWERLQPILEAIAAKTDSGPCVTHVGPDGAGHFVKMVHNGIEYGDMQVMAEIYDVLRRVGDLDNPAIADVFGRWNEGILQSFLVEITARIFTVMDDQTGNHLVDMVEDKAGQKGTGRLTVSLALDLGVAVPTIAAAVDARILSSLRDERKVAAPLLAGPTDGLFDGTGAELIDACHDAMLLARICSYAQGMNMIRQGSDEYDWNIDLKEIARIWKGGCIIRSRLLDTIMKAFGDGEPVRNLILADEMRAHAERSHPALRRVLAVAQNAGVPTPALSASLAWYDAYRTESLPQNLTQAQRDAFGAHTYRRNDRDDGESFHTEWLK